MLFRSVNPPISPPQGINRLIRGNRVNPRSNRAPRLILIHLHKDRHERVLKHIRSKVIVTNVPPQVAVQFAFIAAHERAKKFLLPVLQPGEQHFVRNLISLFVERCHPVILYASRGNEVHSGGFGVSVKIGGGPFGRELIDFGAERLGGQSLKSAEPIQSFNGTSSRSVYHFPVGLVREST